MGLKLREYQQSSIDEIRRRFLQGKQAVLLVLPTGSGKTVVFCKMAQAAIEKQKRILIIVHRIELLNQASEKLISLGVDHGKISPHFMPEYEKHIQVASIDSIIKRLDKISMPDLIIFDECHHVVKGNKFGRLVEKFSNIRILGVTATPIRYGGDGLGVNAKGFFDDLVVGSTVEELTKLKYLVPAKYFAPKSHIEFKKLRIIHGDYDAKELAAKINIPDVTGDAIKHYKKLSDGLLAIVFCVDIQHAMDVAKSFNEAGISSNSIDSSQSYPERTKILESFSKGNIKVICSVNIISEGTDLPNACAAIILRKTMSLSLHLQMIGRVLRPAPNKTHAIIIDHVGNLTEHGFATSEYKWSLDSKPKSDFQGSFLTQCQSCYSVFDFRKHKICPECFEKVPIEHHEKQYLEENLVEVRPEELSPKIKMIRGAKTIDDLKRIAKENNYKPGWVHLMKKFLPQHRAFNI